MKSYLHRSLFMLVLAMTIHLYGQDTIVLFPCMGQRFADGSCPKAADIPPTFNPVISVDDYYDLYVEAVCVDQPDSWWRNKLIHFDITVSVASLSTTVPVFGERTGGQCRIGVANYPLLTSIPANGQKLFVEAKVYRSDDTDGLRKILSFLSDQQKSTVVSTYAAAAVPYLTVVSAIGGQAYEAFANHSETFLNFKRMALSPKADVPNRFDLKDEYFVQYAGNDGPTDNSVFLSPSFELLWSGASDNRVRGGSTWIVYRLQKYTHRQDYPTRPWYLLYQQLMQQARFRQIDATNFEKRLIDAVVLLMADADYTNGDKAYYQSLFQQSESTMVAYLNNPNATPPNLDAAFTAADVAPSVVGFDAASRRFITAVNTQSPVVATWAQKTQVGLTVLDPSKLAQGLKAVPIQ